MSSLFGSNLEQEEKSAEKRGGEVTSAWHEPVSHAAGALQAASLSQTASRWRGLFWACRVESQNPAGFLARRERMPCHQRPLSRCACMLLLRLLKDGRLVTGAIEPHGKDDPDPHIGQRTYRHRMTFSFRSLAEVLVSRPRFTLGGLPGKLMKRIAQWLDTAQATMRLGVHPALKQHRRSSSQGLQTGCIPVSLPVLADFRQQARSQTLTSSRKTAEDDLVSVGQKKGVNLFVILSDQIGRASCRERV